MGFARFLLPLVYASRQATIPCDCFIYPYVFPDILNYEVVPCRVPLVLVPVDAIYEGQEYSAERAKKYLARLRQLTADDVALWLDKVDEFGGTRLDAAMNIVLLDDYFDKEQFQRDKFKAAIGARKE